VVDHAHIVKVLTLTDGPPDRPGKPTVVTYETAGEGQGVGTIDWADGPAAPPYIWPGAPPAPPPTPPTREFSSLVIHCKQ
jgi:hypothetical protein